MVDTREQFERWYNAELDPNMETYAEDKNSHWLAWKAATERAGKAPAPAVPEEWRNMTREARRIQREHLDNHIGDVYHAMQYLCARYAAPQPTGDDR